METSKLILYLALTALTTNLVRILPMLLIRGRIRNLFLRSFLYYVPYVTLAVMTFPAIVQTTSNPSAGATALGVGIVAAWRGWPLFYVSLICCITVLVFELIMPV